MFKLAREDGFDFHTGGTINYRESIGTRVFVPNYNKTLGLCSSGVIHASKKISDCFQGNVAIPCSAYIVTGHPVIVEARKSGFKSLFIKRELTGLELEDAFGFKYYEVINPKHPFRLPKAEMSPGVLEKLTAWVSVWTSVRDSVWTSVRDSVWAYIGSLFPKIINWEYAKAGAYPFQSAVDLWRMGIVPSYDGKIWRLHSGEKAEVIWKGKV